MIFREERLLTGITKSSVKIGKFEETTRGLGKFPPF